MPQDQSDVDVCFPDEIITQIALLAYRMLRNQTCYRLSFKCREDAEDAVQDFLLSIKERAMRDADFSVKEPVQDRFRLANWLVMNEAQRVNFIKLGVTRKGVSAWRKDKKYVAMADLDALVSGTELAMPSSAEPVRTRRKRAA